MVIVRFVVVNLQTTRTAARERREKRRNPNASPTLGHLGKDSRKRADAWRGRKGSRRFPQITAN